MSKLSKLFSDEDLESFKDLFLSELKDLYSAEEQMIEALPKMVEASTSRDLKKAFKDHLQETKQQKARLEQVFESIGEEPESETCKAMKGLIKEAEDMIDEDCNPIVLDAGLIGCAQKVEHYEIAGYGTLREHAKILGYSEAEKLLSATLKEEKHADDLLSKIATSHVNEQAAAADAHAVVLDARGQVVTSSNGSCVRTQWIKGGDVCRKGTSTAVVTNRYQITDEDRTVYFEFDKSNIMDSQSKKLDDLTKVLKSSKDVTGVSIVGYADRIGTADYNEALSKRRAKTVEQYLRDHGYMNTEIAKTAWLGESAPRANCPDSIPRADLIACLQKDRKVTVELRYKDKSTTIIRY